MEDKIFKNMPISRKLIIFFLLVGVIQLTDVGELSYTEGKSAIKDLVFTRLTATRDANKQQSTDYFGFIENQIMTLSEDKMTIQAMKEFNDAFSELGDGDWNRSMIVAQKLYIYDNLNPTGDKDLLNFATDGSKYSELHKKYHPTFRNYINNFGYYDMFLVNADNGHIVYTVFKKLDYGTSLIDGEYLATKIAMVFSSIRNSVESGYILFDDFEPYAPSHGFSASFIASSIVENNEVIGVLVFQKPSKERNDIMSRRAGFGTVKTNIIGSDKPMRSDS